MTAPAITSFGQQPGSGPLRYGGISLSETPNSEADLPSTPNAATKRQASALKVVRDLAAGAERVKLRSTEYLPQNDGERDKNYMTRLKRSVFVNIFGRTIDGLTGLVFTKDPVLGDDVPEIIKGAYDENGVRTVEGLWENIDNAGTHGDVFCRDLFQDALTAGHAAIFVEFPKTDGTQKYSDEVTKAVRPYWVPIKKDHILSWRTAVMGGKTVVTQLVWEECTMVPDGAFGEKQQKRYRVLWNDNGAVGFSLLEVTDRNQVVVVADGLYPTQQEIPVAEIVTSGRKSIFESDPPLLDLAFLNITHYQVLSDYLTSMHMTCVPLLFTAGVQMVDEKGNKIVVGPHSGITANDPQAKAEYVSHSGESLASVKTALDDFKSDMGMLGIAMLAPQKRAAETAEAKRIDKQGSDSALGVSARGFQDGVERALGFTAKYLKLPSGGSIQINRSFDEQVMDPQTMTAYADLADKIGLPVRVILEALVNGGRIADTEDLDALEAEMVAAKAASDAQKAQERQDQLTMAMSGNQSQGMAA